jgi:hypothetical protein
MSKEVLREKLDKGWIHARMFFEVMGASKDVVESAMRDHLGKVKRMENIAIVSEKVESAEKVESPPKKFEGMEVYSQIAEVEVAVSSLENLLYSVLFFGPSSIEIIEPKEMTVKFDSAQAMVNAVAEMMHKYAAAGAGGIVINTKK